MKLRRRKSLYRVYGHGRKGEYLARNPGAAVHQFRREHQPRDNQDLIDGVHSRGALKGVPQFQLVSDHETGGWKDVSWEIVKDSSRARSQS